MAARHRGTERAEPHEVLVLRRVGSCGSSDRRWRTKLNLGSGEPFDDLHRFTTVGTAPEIARVIDG